jgi:hypothetical protein
MRDVRSAFRVPDEALHRRLHVIVIMALRTGQSVVGVRALCILSMRVRYLSSRCSRW